MVVLALALTWYLIFTQLAQAQNLGETLNSFLEVFFFFLNLKHIHSSFFLCLSFFFLSLRKGMNSSLSDTHRGQGL